MNNQLISSNQVNLQFSEISSLGKLFAESGMFSDIKTMAQAVVKIQAGQEIGIPPFASMTGIHIIQGKPCLGAGLIASRVKASGKYDYRVLEQSDKLCSIEFFQNNESIGISTFTYEDGKKAGTKNLDKFPKNMLFARCISNGVKWYCPDVFNTSVYVPEEMDFNNIISSESKITNIRPNLDINNDLDMIQELKEARNKTELKDLSAKYKGQYKTNQEFKKVFDEQVYKFNLDVLESLQNELNSVDSDIKISEIMNKPEYKVLENSDLKDQYKELGEEAIKNLQEKNRQNIIKKINNTANESHLIGLAKLPSCEWYFLHDDEIKEIIKKRKEWFQEQKNKSDEELMVEASKEATEKVLVNK